MRHACPEDETECETCAAVERRRNGYVVTRADSRLLRRDRCTIAPAIAVPYEVTHADVRWLREQAKLAGAKVIHLDARGCPPVDRPEPLDMHGYGSL